MSKSNTHENAYLLLLYNNTNIAQIGDATGLRGSTVAGTIKVALHTADPGETGSQSTNEVSVGGYARATVARSSAGFTVAANVVSNAALVAWALVTSGSQSATHFSFGDDAGGIIHSGALSQALALSAGITPQAAIGALTVTED